MATAKDAIQSAARLIRVKTAGIDLTDEELDDGVELLNDLMFKWDSDNIRIGFTELTSPDDELTVPRWSLSAIKSNLSARMAPEYGKVIGIELAAQIQNDFVTLRQRVTEAFQTYFPDTLPVGSGNQINNTRNQPKFFTDESWDDLYYANDSNMQDDRERQLEQNRDTTQNGS